MLRVRVICPTRLDADSSAHLDAVESFDAVRVRRCAVGDGRRVDTLRAVYAIRGADRHTRLITAGLGAISAARFLRRPSVHLLSPFACKAERDTLAKFDLARIVPANASVNVREFDPTRIVPIDLPVESPIVELNSRTHGRAVYTPGPVMIGSGHRLAVWAVGILNYRDGGWRIVCDAGAGVEKIRRLAARTGQADLVTTTDEIPIESCQAAFFAPDHSTEMIGVLRAMHAGMPVVTTAAAAALARLDAGVVHIVDSKKPRDLARAVDHVRSTRPPIPPRPAVDPARQWLRLLAPAVSMTTRSSP